MEMGLYLSIINFIYKYINIKYIYLKNKNIKYKK